MPNHLRVLIVEDSEADTELLLRELRRAGYDPACERVETADAMRAALDGREWDIVISDYTMPRFDGLEALRLLQQRQLDIPFIVVSGSIGEDIAVTTMKAGAHDYVMKNNPARLAQAVARELKEAQLRREHRQTQERIQHLAYYDPLTDLPNRTLFADRLQQAVFIGRRDNQHFVLMAMDLDRFKEVNDTHGHPAGDQVLQQMATRLKTCLRESDTLARMGGDEFAVLLPPASHLDGAMVMAHKILAAFSKSFQIGDQQLKIGASLGIALFPEHSNSIDMLLGAADAAMYAAKRAQSGFKVYAPDLDSKSGIP